MGQYISQFSCYYSSETISQSSFTDQYQCTDQTFTDQYQYADQISQSSTEQYQCADQYFFTDQCADQSFTDISPQPPVTHSKFNI